MAVWPGPVAPFARLLPRPLTAKGYLPIRAPPKDVFEWGYAACSDDAEEEAPADDVPYFDVAASCTDKAENVRQLIGLKPFSAAAADVGVPLGVPWR